MSEERRPSAAELLGQVINGVVGKALSVSNDDLANDFIDAVLSLTEEIGRLRTDIKNLQRTIQRLK